MTEDAVYRRRHEFKDRIDAEARRMRREVHPAYLAMVSLDGGDICVGIRDRIEMAHVVGDPMVDLSIWIDRRGIPDDPKLDFDAELCDIIIPNYSSVVGKSGTMRPRVPMAKLRPPSRNRP